ncbi:hypothetical protein ACOTHJ_15700 [Achromobacter xylosoxidans]|uniref:hypothetical protein n=1 Tax=Achromobacter anxifer TaxID=1287737 RepID=UPI00155CDDF6|nr:hypothetical protein [Achromobacter anxifer]CAB5514443.1 hypothetical protein LMG26857_03502 [Achromobacter anxifer]
MKLLNYAKVFGAFTDAHQLIVLPLKPAPTDRAGQKMLEEARRLLDAGWTRRLDWLTSRKEKHDEDFDLEVERAAFFPKEADGNVHMPFQYVMDYMVRKIAALQNNVSIHNTKEVAELREVFDIYGVQLIPRLENIEFSHINWSAREGQKPKLMVHGKDADGDICIRFEAAGELCQKFMNAMLDLHLQPGQHFNLAVEAVDPAIERNKKAGKKVADPGKYVNHNMTLTVVETGVIHTGHPPKGTRFVQKPTIEQLEHLFRKAQSATLPARAAA